MSSVKLERGQFPIAQTIQTRWSDNDQYGHANNAFYYMYLDTAVNGWLMEVTGTDVSKLQSIGVVVSSSCDYIAPVGFPDVLEVGMATSRIGTSSISYSLAVFRQRDELLCARAEFVHVYVDRESRRPVPIPEVIRQAVTQLPTMPSPRVVHPG